MAKSSKTPTKEETAQELNLELRTSLNNAFAAVEGQKKTKSFAAVTFEELLDDQIQRLSVGSQGRPSSLEKVQRTLNDLTKAIKQINDMPADAFAKPDSNTDVNTPKG
jgi:hypothetical protein